MVHSTEAWRDSWRNRADYADAFYRHAVGELPEMESSKAAATLLSDQIRPGDSVLDVGCGGGHYLRSLRRLIQTPFSYVGVDATEGFLDAARRAWNGTPDVVFREGDIFNLPFDNNEFDVVMCNNLLYHLPSVVGPLAELFRVARRLILIRTLVGDQSYRIQRVDSSAVKPGSDINPVDEFADDGEPRSFAFYNIYARHYLDGVFARVTPDAKIEYLEDVWFSPEAIERSATKDWKSKPNPTRMLDGKQVSGYIILPYHFVMIHKQQES